ncbi:MAG: hypothetical protein J5749_02215 [Lachnospiraceae bacterium]|nr:hypothetical protein [Lachnospiraceae bacterium]
MSNSDKEMRFFSILILAVLAIYVAVYSVTYIGTRKEETQKEQERLASYPALDELLEHEDEIIGISTVERDIVYTLRDKEEIHKVMEILRGLELTPVYVDEKDVVERPVGGFATAAQLSFDFDDNMKTYWHIDIDVPGLNTDFEIYQWDGTRGKYGYYTKPNTAWSDVKYILYNGERTDLNEQAALHPDPEIDFSYNPETVFDGEELNFVKESGYETTDIDISSDKVFFCCNRAIETDIDYVDYEGVLFDYVWGYADKDGENRTVFTIKSDDAEYPYAGIQGIVGATESKIYAYLFCAKMTDGEDSYNKAEIKHYLASFNYDGELIDKVPLDYSFYKGLSVDGIVTESGKVAIFSDGNTVSLYDENLNLISTVTDKEITYIAKGPDGNVVALLWNTDYIKHVVYDATNLKVVDEYPMQYYKFEEHPLGVTDDYRILAIRYDKETNRSKIITVYVDNYGASELMDVTASRGDDGDYIESAWLEDDNTIFVEERTDYDRHYVSLIRYAKGTENN